MMPKGVEHRMRFLDSLLRSIVMNSMMPKGVEHTHRGSQVFFASRVMNSMMPKGVEHGAVRAVIGGAYA